MSSKRAFVFANGEMPNINWLKGKLFAADLLIAVDGGLNYLYQLGTPPHLLIGDLDSASADQIEWAQKGGAKVERYPIAKDETDLELALLTARDLGYEEIIIVAGLGGRLDQTLGNLSLLRLPALRNCALRFEDGLSEVFIIRERARIAGQKGDIVSLLPLWGAAEGVLTENLDYPLQRETLYPEHTRGISNVMSGAEAEVSLGKGELLCVHTLSTLKEE